MSPVDFLRGSFQKVSSFVLFSIFCPLHRALNPWWQRPYLLVDCCTSRMVPSLEFGGSRHALNTC